MPGDELQYLRTGVLVCLQCVGSVCCWALFVRKLGYCECGTVPVVYKQFFSWCVKCSFLLFDLYVDLPSVSWDQVCCVASSVASRVLSTHILFVFSIIVYLTSKYLNCGPGFCEPKQEVLSDQWVLVVSAWVSLTKVG